METEEELRTVGKTETAFIMDTSRIKFGVGVTVEIGEDMKALDCKRVMVVTDPNLSDSQPVSRVLQALQKTNIDAVLFDKVRVEPTDVSFKLAIDFALDGDFDGFVAVGGGSSMDTAKVANLYSTYPADLLTYVNQPIGQGEPVPGVVKPLIAVPTTAGTGSETTGVAIFDLLEIHAKTGIADRALRPILGIVDPDNTRTMPPIVAACSGLDVLSHALESMTALPYTGRLAPESSKHRPAYQGANPISHIWASEATKMVSENLVRAVTDPDDDQARGQMLLASTYAGIGFGNAGVHLPHGMSYPVAGMVRDYIPTGFPRPASNSSPIVPHGMSVILNAPAVFRFTASTNPALHLYAANLMGVDTSNSDTASAGDVLATAITDLMQQTGIPNGLSALGYQLSDIPQLVEGTLPQHRVTKLSPRPADSEALTGLFQDSMVCW
jgi:hydroxyacid-oxoacid transhydrogenase